MQENFHIGTNMGIKTLYHNLSNFQKCFWKPRKCQGSKYNLKAKSAVYESSKSSVKALPTSKEN